MALDLVPGDSTEGHAVVEGDVIPDLGGFTDDHPHPVVNEKLVADLAPRGEFRCR